MSKKHIHPAIDMKQLNDNLMTELHKILWNSSHIINSPEFLNAQNPKP